MVWYCVITADDALDFLNYNIFGRLIYAFCRNVAKNFTSANTQAN